MRKPRRAQPREKPMNAAKTAAEMQIDSSAPLPTVTHDSPTIPQRYSRHLETYRAMLEQDEEEDFREGERELVEPTREESSRKLAAVQSAARAGDAAALAEALAEFAGDDAAQQHLEDGIVRAYYGGDDRNAKPTEAVRRDAERIAAGHSPAMAPIR